MKQYLFILLMLIVIVAASCRSNDPADLSGYSFVEHETPPGMKLIEGGTFIFQNPDGTVTTEKIRAFYISEAEETNEQYLAYLSWLKKRFSYSTYAKALPDTTVWLREYLPDSIRQFLVKNYLRHFAYRTFPVVGLTPQQVEKYCLWKSDRLNEMLLTKKGIIEPNPESDSIDYFTLAPYRPSWTDSVVWKRSKPPSRKEKKLPQMEDDAHILWYRIPSPNEWKVAASAIADKENTYIKTPKAINNRKFDKEDEFGHLYGRAGVVSNYVGMPLYMGKGPKPIHWAKMNNYRLQGMNANVSELVKSGNSYSIIGGSWKIPEADHSLQYDSAVPDSLRYLVKNAFYTNASEENFVSAAAGFRVVMTCKGAGHGKIYGKRKKAKG